MTLESIEKLRKALKDCTSVSGVEPNQFDTYWITAAACDKYIDEIEREIAEKYMELPVDADGVPIRVGDEMESDNERFVVCAVAPGRVHRWHVHNIGELDSGTVAYPPGLLHHFKPRTVEDVLKEFGDWYKHVAGGCDEPGIIAEYADELRGMGVGE